MNPFIYFIFGLIVGGLVVWFFIYKKQSQHSHILPPSHDLRFAGGFGKARATDGQGKNVGMSEKPLGLVEKQAKEKEENKKRILGVLETQSPLTNNHIEQLLGISDATATRYLDELEKEGRIRQVGKTGRYVNYEKI